MSGNRKLIFYGAMSVDGYLARENDSLDWLLGTDGEDETGYSAFYSQVDTILMGRRTYEQIVSALSPEHFPYEGRECYVFSRSVTGRNDKVTFINEDIVTFTNALKNKSGNNIWMIGGGEVLRPLIESRMVDQYIIQIAPAIIGRGLSLFNPSDIDARLKLIDVRRYQQLAELRYEVE